jgi:hypothetical protein
MVARLRGMTDFLSCTELHLLRMDPLTDIQTCYHEGFRYTLTGKQDAFYYFSVLILRKNHCGES